MQENPASENKLSVSSRIFLDSEITLKPVYASKLEDFYKTDVTPANFSDAQKTSSEINSWTAKATMGSINRLTDPGNNSYAIIITVRCVGVIESTNIFYPKTYLDDLKDMVMLLANAIYFKGIWRYPFPKNETCIGGFYPTPTIKIYLPYMVATNSFYFFESPTLEAKILRLPYKVIF